MNDEKKNNKNYQLSPGFIICLLPSKYSVPLNISSYMEEKSDALSDFRKVVTFFNSCVAQMGINPKLVNF